MTEVIDVEVVSDETTFTPSPEGLPFSGSPSDWCHFGQHVQCPAVWWPRKHPDPARKGATYTLPGRRCPCVCHSRPVL